MLCIMLLRVLSVCGLIISAVVADNSDNNTKSAVNLCGPSAAYENYTTLKTETCGCGDKNVCVRKCCQQGYYHYHEENYFTGIFKSVCIKHNASSFTVPIYKGTKKKFDLTDKFMVGMLNCKNQKWQYFKMNNSDPNEKFYIQNNGSLYYPYSFRKFYNNSRYCVDEEDGLTAYLCYTPEEPGKVLGRFLTSIGMIISMPFLLATFLVYAILPDSNLHRKALMSYVLTLLLAYIFLVTVQLHDGQLPEAICELLGYSVIFFFMVSFFWMNVMCVDMWLAFSGLRGFGKRHTERKRFIFYCLYAWGMPVLHVIVVWLMNDYGAKDQIYYPGIGAVKCFLNDGYPNLFYFYGPMAILITINIVLFILTAVKIQKVKKETAMLKHSDSKRHSYEDDKQKFNLYLKLLFAMGINWTMEIISWAVNWKMGTNLPPSVWYLTDFCNAMYGAFIFFIFVFKKKIWKTLQKRYYVFIGKPHLAHSMTTTQTTRSSNYSTTETGLADHRLSELRNGRGEERVLTQN